MRHAARARLSRTQNIRRLLAFGMRYGRGMEGSYRLFQTAWPCFCALMLVSDSAMSRSQCLQGVLELSRSGSCASRCVCSDVDAPLLQHEGCRGPNYGGQHGILASPNRSAEILLARNLTCDFEAIYLEL